MDEIGRYQDSMGRWSPSGWNSDEQVGDFLVLDRWTDAAKRGDAVQH